MGVYKWNVDVKWFNEKSNRESKTILPLIKSGKLGRLQAEEATTAK